MTMAVDDDDNDDYDVGTLMNRIKQIYADFHKKTDLLNRRNLRVPTLNCLKLTSISVITIGTQIRDN